LNAKHYVIIKKALSKHAVNLPRKGVGPMKYFIIWLIVTMIMLVWNYAAHKNDNR